MLFSATGRFAASDISPHRAWELIQEVPVDQTHSLFVSCVCKRFVINDWLVAWHLSRLGRRIVSAINCASERCGAFVT